MRALDTPIRLAAGRTARELVLIGHGVASVAVACAIGDRSWNIYAYLGITLLFATRMFAGRVLYLSLCTGAAALQLAHLLLPRVTLADQAPVLLQILGVALLLCGPDLVRRFDDEGRGLGPIRNLWRELTVAQRRHLAWGVHLVGATGGLAHHIAFTLDGFRQPSPPWLLAAVVACGVICTLYIAGRAIAAPLAVIAGGAIAWTLAPHLDEARAVLDGRFPATRVAPEVWFSAHYVVVAFACALASAVIALPWAGRWLALAWRRR